MEAVFYLLYLGFCILEAFSPVPPCYVSQLLLISLFILNELAILFLKEDLERRRRRLIVKGMERLRIISSSLVVVFYLINLHKTPQCMTNTFRIMIFIPVFGALFVNLAFVTCFIVWTFFLLIIKCWRHFYDRPFMEDFNKQVRSAQDDPSRLAVFYSTHKEALQHVAITTEEQKLYTLYFCRPFSRMRNDYQDSSCSICLNDFEQGEETLLFPECKHLFHSECLTRWFDGNKQICPLCKQDFRSSFAAALMNILTTKTFRVSVQELAVKNNNTRPQGCCGGNNGGHSHKPTAETMNRDDVVGDDESED